MKQVETISVGGYAFTMEAEASAAAGAYLSELEAFYGSREIMEGIEERMAELLLEKTPAEGVVSKQTVSEIIDILGRPERLEAEEESAREARPSGEKAEKPRKKLYRDLEGGKLGGVLSGLGIYFGIDVVALRVIVTILAIAGFFGSANSDSGFLFFIIPLIYCILWISMPAAKTARQRWEQRGEDGSVEGIRRSVESGAGRVGDAIRDISRAPAWRTIGRVLEVTIGIILLITAVSGLFAGALA
ncbi:MAG: PspC domain-containing protein, partial [Bacteroidales bacterium]|nr:PspC domain-containing protein [Bacteroidales bacterium]